MKKFLLLLLGFFLCSFLFYSVMLFCWVNIAPERFKPNMKYRLGGYGHTHTRLKEVKDLNGVDILFLGSSHTYRGFDTRIFQQSGYSSFNLGTSAQTPMQTEVLLSRYLKTIKPKLIIYEVFPINSDGVEASLDLIANDKNDIYSFEMVLKANNLKTYNTFLYGSLRNLFQLDSEFSQDNVRGEDTYVEGGYVERNMKFFKGRTFKKNDIDLKSSQLQGFSKVIEIFKNYEIPYLLVYAPISKALYNSYTNNGEFDDWMAKKGEFINFNEVMHLNDTVDFYDSHHLNQKGVSKFDTFLIDNYLSRENMIHSNKAN